METGKRGGPRIRKEDRTSVQAHSIGERRVGSRREREAWFADEDEVALHFGTSHVFELPGRQVISGSVIGWSSHL